MAARTSPRPALVPRGPAGLVAAPGGPGHQAPPGPPKPPPQGPDQPLLGRDRLVCVLGPQPNAALVPAFCASWHSTASLPSAPGSRKSKSQADEPVDGISLSCPAMSTALPSIRSRYIDRVRHDPAAHKI